MTRLPALFALTIATTSAPGVAQELQWSGEVSTAVGVRVLACADDCPLSNYTNRNILRLRLDSELTTRVAVRGEVGLYNLNEPKVATVEDSADSRNVVPVRVRVGEAWVDGYDLLTEGLDLRVGNQRIRWGTADGYSPTDRINPYDLEDPTLFDRRLPTPAAHLRYHLGDLTFSAAWLPFFVPALLAPDVVEIATSEEAARDVDIDFGDAEPPEIRDLDTRIILPPQTLGEMQVATRIQWAAPFGDFGLGYFYGRDTLPQLSGEVIPESFFSMEEVDVIVNVRYPRLQMLAADARAPLFAGMTGWLDLGVIFPTRTRLYISEERLEDLARLNIIDEPDGDVEVEIQSGEPYVTFATGLDRSFGPHVYLNVQYLYGFLFERNPQDLHHYAIATLRIPAQDAPVEWEVRAGAEANPALDAFGWLASSRLAVRHDDALELALSAQLQDGQTGSTLALFAPLSEVRLTAAARF